MLCRASQVLAKFARDNLANYTPTFFRQCIQMHATLPPTHDLFTSSVETATVTPTHAQLLAVGLHQSICSLRQLRTPLPRPVSQLGLWHNFVVATRKEEAFDLVDGDGGTSSWVTSQVFMTTYYRQGLQPSCGRRACMAIWCRSGAMGTMPWSLSTCTTAQMSHHHLGYEVLCAAHSAVATAAKVSVHTAGEVDVYGRRLACTFAIGTSQGTSTSILKQYTAILCMRGVCTCSSWARPGRRRLLLVSMPSAPNTNLQHWRHLINTASKDSDQEYAVILCMRGVCTCSSWARPGRRRLLLVSMPSAPNTNLQHWRHLINTASKEMSVTSSNPPSCPAVHARSVHMLLVG